jgi:hypothetical protein
MADQLSAAEMVAAIAHDHPGRHPYTLALLLQARYGRTLDGREVARLMAGLIPGQTGGKLLL